MKKAISHEVPDKVPFDLGSTTVTGIHALACGNLKRAFKVHGGATKVYEPFQMLTEVEDSVRKALEVDTFGIQLPCTPFGVKNENWKSPEWAMKGAPSSATWRRNGLIFSFDFGFITPACS